MASKEDLIDLWKKIWQHDRAQHVDEKSGSRFVEREEMESSLNIDVELEGSLPSSTVVPLPVIKKRQFSLSTGQQIIISLLVLVCLTIFQTYVVSLTGDVIGGFYTSISNHDAHQFFYVALLAFGVVLLSALLDSTIKACVEGLAWQLRRSLSALLQDNYFRGTRFYSILFSIDNPDQRITQDVDNWSSSLASITAQVVAAPLIIVYYSVFTFTFIAWYAPLLIYLWFFLGYLTNRLLMQPLSEIIFKQEQYEGDYRYEHARVRSDAESIAICRGGYVELQNSNSKFQKVLQNRLRIIKWHWGLNSTSNVFSYVTTVLNYTIVALPVLFFGSKQVDPADISGYVAKASFYIIMLASGFSTFLNISSLLSDFFGYTARILQLLKGLETVCPDHASAFSAPAHSPPDHHETNGHDVDHDDDDPLLSPSDDASSAPFAASSSITTPPPPPPIATAPFGLSLSPIVSSSSPWLSTDNRPGKLLVAEDRVEFQHVTYEIPGSTRIVRDLSFLVQPGKNLLIMGPSGAGKSCLIRILSGIWRMKEGIIVRPAQIQAQAFTAPDPPMMMMMMATETTPRRPQSPAYLDGGHSFEGGIPQRGIHFLPQNPYFPTGSIGYQLTYPLLPSETNISQQTICDLLSVVELSHLKFRQEIWHDDTAMQCVADETSKSKQDNYNLVHWTDLLSPGERQRLAFARVFFHHPVFAVLDEATSALSVSMEAHLYQECHRRGITLVSVGHRESLLPYHQFILRFSKSSEWSFEPNLASIY